MIATSAVLLTLLLPPAGGARERSPGIESLAWMAGHWIGTRRDLSEEIWLAPAAGSMVGMWRWAPAGSLRLYELLAIAADGDRLVLRLRHFHPDLTALEDKSAPFVLPLVASAPNEATFEGRGSDGGPLRITYRRLSPDTLEARLEKGGTTETFSYQRKP